MHKLHPVHLPFMAFVLICFAATFMGADCQTGGGGKCAKFGDQNFCQSGDGGGGGGPTYPPLPTATPLPTPGATPVAQLYGIAPYTYSENQCWVGKEVDPIDVVFFGNATAQNVYNHGIDHGGWLYQDGSPQSFWRDACLAMDGQSASGPVFQLPGRFHMRFFSDNVGPSLGIIAVADAHHEDVDWCGHVTDHEDDNGGVSGFDMGRNDIASNWSAGGHTVTIVVWDNIRPMRQCDDRTSKSDGNTIFVSVN